MATQFYLILKAGPNNSSFKNMGGFSATSLITAKKGVQKKVDAGTWKPGEYLLVDRVTNVSARKKPVTKKRPVAKRRKKK